MFELTPDVYVSTIWFIRHNDDLPVPERVDWLGSLTRRDGEPWTFDYRFRYHRSEEVWDSGDERSWTRFRIAADLPEDEVLAKIETMVSVISAKLGTPVCVVPVHGDGDRAAQLLGQQPWCHLREATPEEVAEWQPPPPSPPPPRRRKRR